MGAKKPPAGVHSLINEAGAVTSMSDVAGSTSAAELELDNDDDEVEPSPEEEEEEYDEDDEDAGDAEDDADDPDPLVLVDEEPDEEPDVVGTPVVAEVEIPAVVE